MHISLHFLIFCQGFLEDFLKYRSIWICRGDFDGVNHPKTAALFQEPFVADRGVDPVTWNDLLEKLKGRKHGVNCNADA